MIFIGLGGVGGKTPLPAARSVVMPRIKVTTVVKFYKEWCALAFAVQPLPLYIVGSLRITAGLLSGTQVW